MEDDENDEFNKPEGNFQMSQTIMKDTASERQERVNVQTNMKQRIAKKKLAAMKESKMEQQKLKKYEMKEWNRGIRERKLMMLKIVLWLAWLMSLDSYHSEKGYWRKMKSKTYYFDTNCKFWINKMLRRVISKWIKTSTVKTVLFLN